VYEEARGVFEELDVVVREHGAEREVAALAVRLLAEAQGRRFLGESATDSEGL